MATLIVQPFDPKAKGSFRQRMALLQAFERMGAAKKSNLTTDYAAAQAELFRATISRLSTDDGTPVDDLLDELSADDFDTLMDATLMEARAPAVPPEKGAP